MTVLLIIAAVVLLDTLIDWSNRRSRRDRDAVAAELRRSLERFDESWPS